ncbi:hypothetical protein [Caulobacter vibrioides]|uniref:hypothetical protein n=1 Tax=Caulobacter vibrioides TaxID=155892 RepID=UPI001ABF2F8D|nr:hypothetical protein [Caulobacter vibrioides]
MLWVMSQTRPSTRTWCDRLQQKLMDAIDAAWAMMEASDDPAVLAKARDRARVCGQLASEARKVLALDPKPDKPSKLPAAIHEAFDRLDAIGAPILAEAEKRREAQSAAHRRPRRLRPWPCRRRWTKLKRTVGASSAPSVTSPIGAATPPPLCEGGGHSSPFTHLKERRLTPMRENSIS